MKILLAPFLLAVAAFCAYGFMATFEPSPNAMPFRFGYAIVGLGAIAALAILIKTPTRRS